MKVRGVKRRFSTGGSRLCKPFRPFYFLFFLTDWENIREYCFVHMIVIGWRLSLAALFFPNFVKLIGDMFKGFWWGVYDRVTNVKYLENLCTVEAELTNPVPGSLSVPAVGVAAAATPSVQMLPEIPPPSCQELVPPSERTSLPTSAFFKVSKLTSYFTLYYA